MPISFIEDIVVHGLDASGNEVTCIYAKKPPEYLVYRDPARVDDPFRRQRSCGPAPAHRPGCIEPCAARSAA